MGKTIAQNLLVLILGSSLVVLALVSWSCREKPSGPPPVNRAHVAEWVARLKDRDPNIRHNARMTVMDLGEPAVPLLIELLDGENGEGRFEATVALCGIRSDARSAAVPALIRIVKEGGPELQRAAIETLASIGPTARAAAPGLREVLRSRKAGYERGLPAFLFVPMALACIQGEEAVPLLIELLEDADLQLEAVRALGIVGPSAGSALPALRAKAEKSPPDLRLAIERTMHRIGRGQRAKESSAG